MADPGNENAQAGGLGISKRIVPLASVNGKQDTPSGHRQQVVFDQRPRRREADPACAPAEMQAARELRHLWLRLEIAQTSVVWAVGEIAAGRLNALGATVIIDEVMETVGGQIGA